jgi:hypothetical protein
LPVKEKSARGDRLSLAIAESLHELSKGCLALDFKEHLVIVIGDFNVKMLRLGLWSALFRHI